MVANTWSNRRLIWDTPRPTPSPKPIAHQDQGEDQKQLLLTKRKHNLPQALKHLAQTNAVKKIALGTGLKAFSI